MDEHPDSPIWHKAIQGLLPKAVKFRGTLFRACEPVYATTQDLLTGEGACRDGGRWNAPGRFPVAYLSLSVEGALAEAMGLASHYAFDPAARLPLTLVAIDAVLDSVLDLTDAPVRRVLGITLSAMNTCPWRTENTQGREAATQALGRAAYTAGIQGVIVSSALSRTIRHLNVFPSNLGKGGTLKIQRADKLPAPPASGVI